jgi:5-methylcytosine-specific restriction endonuclease McrA
LAADNAVKSGGKEDVVRPNSGLGGIKSQYPSGSEPVVAGGKKEDVVRPQGGLVKPGSLEPAKDAKKWTGITLGPKQAAALTSSAAGAKPAEAAKPAAAAKAEKKDDKKDAWPTTGTTKKEPSKVFIEKYDGKLQKDPIVLNLGEGAEAVKTGIFIGNCKGPGIVVQITGKCKNITVSNCMDIAVVFDTCVTTVECIGSKKLQVQASVACGSYIIDKCDRTSLFLADESLKDQVVVYTCQSTASVVHQTKGDDMVEHAIPNQILSTFAQDKAPTHKEVVPEAA